MLIICDINVLSQQTHVTETYSAAGGPVEKLCEQCEYLENL